MHSTRNVHSFSRRRSSGRRGTGGHVPCGEGAATGPAGAIPSSHRSKSGRRTPRAAGSRRRSRYHRQPALERQRCRSLREGAPSQHTNDHQHQHIGDLGRGSSSSRNLPIVLFRTRHTTLKGPNRLSPVGVSSCLRYLAAISSSVMFMGGCQWLSVCRATATRETLSVAMALYVLSELNWLGDCAK